MGSSSLSSDVLTWLLAVGSYAFTWAGVVSGLLWIWAQHSGDDSRSFIRNRVVWAWIAVGCITIGMFKAWQDEHGKVAGAGSSYAIVSSDGQIVSAQNFSRYGVTVEKRAENRPDGTFAWNVYIVTFQVEPDHFKIETDGAVTPWRDPIGPHQYRVGFVHAGAGSLVVDTDFRIVVY